MTILTKVKAVNHNQSNLVGVTPLLMNLDVVTQEMAVQKILEGIQRRVKIEIVERRRVQSKGSLNKDKKEK